MIWCGSTEVYHAPSAVHQSMRDFECGLATNHPDISPSQIYAYGALRSGVPYANGAPHLTVEAPALYKKWPEKYNAAGHFSWTGRIYGKDLARSLSQLTRIYQGAWGAAPFQSLYQLEPHTALSVLLMPEWYLIVSFLGITSALCWDQERLWIVLLMFILSISAPVIQAWRSSERATFPYARLSRIGRMSLRLLTALFYSLRRNQCNMCSLSVERATLGVRLARRWHRKDFSRLSSMISVWAIAGRSNGGRSSQEIWRIGAWSAGRWRSIASAR
jgi:hypothetical protein